MRFIWNTTKTTLLMAGLMGLALAMLIQLAISRSREYEADRLGAELAGDPRGLARALEKLESGASQIPLPVMDSQRGLFIVEPLVGSGIARLFMTHPPVPDRIRRLPVVPEVLTFLAGLARMHFGRFCLALVLGALPASLLLAWAGQAAGTSSALLLVLTLIPAGLWCVYLLAVRHRRPGRACGPPAEAPSEST